MSGAGQRLHSRRSTMIYRMGPGVVAGMIAWLGILFGVALLVRLALEILIAAYLA
jgi:lipopolysaccharide export LptBFGC system permease protein LptF